MRLLISHDMRDPGLLRQHGSLKCIVAVQRRRREIADAHGSRAASEKAEKLRRIVRKVDDAAIVIRPAVVDPDNDRSIGSCGIPILLDYLK